MGRGVNSANFTFSDYDDEKQHSSGNVVSAHHGDGDESSWSQSSQQKRQRGTAGNRSFLQSCGHLHFAMASPAAPPFQSRGNNKL